MNNWFDWYAAFGPATWRDWSLVVLAGFAGWAALGTLKAGIRAAVAAEESNRHAKETAQAELRAYVLLKNIDFQGQERYNQRTNGWDMITEHFAVTLRNAGRTPAYNLTGWGNWHLIEDLDADLPDNFSFPKQCDDESLLKSKVTLSPDNDHPLVFSIDPVVVTTAERHRNRTLYIYGAAEYADVFGNQQTTPFCFRYYVGDGRKGFVTYNQHNNPT